MSKIIEYNNNFQKITENDSIFKDKKTRLNGNFHIKDYIYFTNEQNSFLIVHNKGEIYKVNANVFYYLSDLNFSVKNKFKEVDNAIAYNKKLNSYNLHKINSLNKKVRSLNKKLSNIIDKPHSSKCI